MRVKIRDIVSGISYVFIAAGLVMFFGIAGASDADMIGIAEMIRYVFKSSVIIVGGVALNLIGGEMNV